MYDNQTDRDHGAPDAGEQSGAPSRRARAAKPGYVTLLDNAHTRRLIAGQLGIRAEQLREPSDDLHPGEVQANGDIAELLDDLIDALRAV